MGKDYLYYGFIEEFLDNEKYGAPYMERDDKNKDIKDKHASVELEDFFYSNKKEIIEFIEVYNVLRSLNTLKTEIKINVEGYDILSKDVISEDSIIYGEYGCNNNDLKNTLQIYFSNRYNKLYEKLFTKIIKSQLEREFRTTSYTFLEALQRVEL
jgi:hypothetical protein